MAPSMTRRRALGLGAAVAGGAAAASIGVALPTRPSAVVSSTAQNSSSRPGLLPVSMAMHLHASFSEGAASMETHLDQAERAGVDVIWWTEHDFRVQAHGYRQAVRFEGVVEPEGQLDWTWTSSQAGEVTDATGTFVDAPHSPEEPGRALRLRATGPGNDWGVLTFEGAAWNSTYTTNLSDTVLELDVLAESVGPDAELVVELLSSYRPARGDRPAGQYTLQYRVGPTAGRTTEGDGRLGVVSRPAPNTWIRMQMRPVDDIAALWPDLVAGDSGLFVLRLLVRARRGATVSAVVDRLRFVRQRRDDQSALLIQSELMAAYAARYPRVRQHQGGELSLVRHLNRFGGRAFLPDYGDGPPFKDDSIEAAMAMVEQVHAHRGIASYNHPPSGDPTALGRELVETGNLGAELIEVGTGRSITSLAYAYDIAARNGVFVTATGVTDDHDGDDWAGQETRWITSAWAASTDEAELVSALTAGRCWVVDPAAYRGSIDISVQGRAGMGGVLVTQATRVPVEVTLTDLPKDSTVEVLTGLADLAGLGDLRPVNDLMTVPAIRAERRIGLDLLPGTGRYVRAMVRDAAGAVVGFSNPLWVLPKTPPGGVPAERRL